MNLDAHASKTACVTLEDVLVAASIHASALAPETSGYLTLALADATNRLPLGVEPRAVLLTTEGTVTLARRGPVLAPEAAATAVRELLARLLEVSAGRMPGLAAAARPRVESAQGVDAVVQDIEGALIPVNRAAGRRALARLARETTRAREMGKIAAALRKAAGITLKPAPRDLATTLVGVAPQPEPSPVSVAAPALVQASPAPLASEAAAMDAADASAAQLPLNLEPSIPVDVVHEPFEATPTSLGMSLMVEEVPVIAPSPSRRPTAIETAPWGALDEATLARLDLDALSKPSMESESIAGTGIVVPPPAARTLVSASEAPPPSSESPVVELFVEDMPHDVAASSSSEPQVEARCAVAPTQPETEAEPIARTLSDDEPALVVAKPEPTPFVFELLRRAASASSPPPPSDRTRTDDLLDRFGGGPASDEQSLRAAASSLKTLIGLSPTPPPSAALAFLPSPDVRESAPPLPPPAPAPQLARSESAPFVVRRAARGQSFALPVACFALGVLVAGAAVTALRPDLLTDLAARLGRSNAHQPAPAVTAVDRVAAPAEAARRGPTRAEREAQPASRQRSGD